MDSIRAISTISTPIPARAINTPPSHNAYPQYCNGLRGMMRRHGADSKRSAETCSKGKKEAGPRRAPLRTYMEVPSTGQRRPALPRASPAVPSALGGLASGFGMGPGVPRPPWPLTGGRRSAHFNFASSFIHAVFIPMQEMFTNSISASNDKQKPFYASKCIGRYRAF